MIEKKKAQNVYTSMVKQSRKVMIIPMFLRMFMRVAFRGMTGRWRLIPMLVRYLVIDYKNRKSCGGLQSLAFLNRTDKCSYLFEELVLSYPSIPPS